MVFGIADDPWLLSLARLVGWWYLEAKCRQLYQATWKGSDPRLRMMFRQITFDCIVVQRMWKLEDGPDLYPPIEIDFREVLERDIGDDVGFLRGLAATIAIGKFFPDDSECQNVTDRVVRRLGWIASALETKGYPWMTTNT